jgi:hypothetical protein
MRTLTPSAIAAFVNCPYRYYLGYLLKIYPIRYSPALVLGKGLHAGIGRIQTSTRVDPLPDAMVAARAAMKDDLVKLKQLMDGDEFGAALEQAKRDRAKVYAMLRAYLEVYPQRLPMVKMEGIFKPSPIINPATGKESRTFNWSGIYDGLYRLEDGRYVLYELKSTSDSLKEAAQVLSQSLQPQLYLAMIPDSVHIAGVCIDIVKKPVTPWKETKTDDRTAAAKHLQKAKERRDKWQAKIDAGSKAKAARENVERAELAIRTYQEHLNQAVRCEPLQDYEDRCYKGYVKQPKRFFRRVMLPRQPRRIREAQVVAWRIAQEIRDSDRYGYLACRGNNCKSTNGWCDYRSLCWYDNFDQYRHGEFAHEELELSI